MDTLIISPESEITEFKCYNVVHTIKNSFVLPYEKYHADMQMTVVGDKIIVPPMFFEYYKARLPHKNIVCGILNPDGHYPVNIAYNTAVTEKFAICNEKYTDRVILQSVIDAGLEIIDVKQGYAKCSVCVAGNGIITADKGIYKKISGKMDALLISPGFVNLPGCEYGFLGGASGFDGYLYFMGDIKAHPDFYRIDMFLKKIGVIYECLPGELTDFGTAVFI